MFKKIICMLFASCSLVASGTQVIDFGKMNYSSFNQEACDLGQYAFNRAPELIPYFGHLKQKYKLDTVVETGTFLGGTTLILSQLFNQVHTIERDEARYQAAATKFSSYNNIQCHLGSSERVLNQLLPSLQQQRLLFYLDAHWNKFWPLLDELREIAKTHKNNCVIVIDDFKVPQRKDIPFDSYGPHECSIEYIKADLKNIFDGYVLKYVIPKSVNSRAKCVIIPAEWESKFSN